jgi:hypothetical protein
MKSKVGFALLISCVILSGVAVGKVASRDVAPPRVRGNADPGRLPEVLREVLEAAPTLPRGPSDLLRDYEDGMRDVSARCISELEAISRAHAAGQLTRDRAEYLSEERYQVAMMQFELLSALHTQLEQEVERQAASRADQNVPAENASDVMVNLPLSSFELTASLAHYLELRPSQIRAIEEVLSDERKTEKPLMQDLRYAGQEISRLKQEPEPDRSQVETLGAFQKSVLSNLIAANSRMQARIHAVLTEVQRTRLEQFRRANETKTAGAE